MALSKKPAVFPEGRYKLLLIDQLLDGPLSFSLSKPIVTVGLNQDADCVIPLDTMGLTRLLPLMPRKIVEKHLMKLCYDFGAEKWNVDDALPDPDHMPFNPILAGIHGMEASEPKRPDLNEGDFVKVFLPESWGAFVLKLVDTGKLSLETDDPEAQDDTGIPGFEKTMLSKLPHIPMRIIASLVGRGGYHLDKMCHADPYILPKLIGEVEFKKIGFFSSYHGTDKVLSCFRQLHLLSRDSLKMVEITRKKSTPAYEIFRENFSQEVRNVILAEVVKLFAGAELEEIKIHLGELTLVGRVSEKLKKLEVDARSSLVNPNLVWAKLASLRLPPTTEVKVVLEHEQNFAGCATDERPNVLLGNVAEVHWQGCSFCLFPPFVLMPNLKRLTLSPSPFDPFALRVVVGLSGAKLLLLTKVTVGACAKWMGVVLAAFAMAAPNVEKISWSSNSICGCCNLEVAVACAPIIKMFRNLKTFRVEFDGFARDEDAAVTLFKELAHVPSVTISSLLTAGSEAHFRRRFSDLEQLGKVVNIELDYECSDITDADEDVDMPEEGSYGSNEDFEEESAMEDDVDLMEEGSGEETGQDFCGEDEENSPEIGENEEEAGTASSCSEDETAGGECHKKEPSFAENQRNSSCGSEEDKPSSNISGNCGKESISGSNEGMPDGGIAVSEGADVPGGAEDDNVSVDPDDDSSDDGKDRAFNVVVRDHDFDGEDDDDEFFLF